MRRALWGVAVALLLSWPAAAEERVLTLDPQKTEVTFTLDSALHTVEGRFYLQSGEVRFDPATGAASGLLRFDARRGETGNSSRDRKMHGKVLESDSYPWIELVPDHFAGTLPEQGRSEVKLSGSFLLHGERHPMTLTATLEVAGSQLTAKTDFKVPYIEWGLADPSILFLKVDREVQVAVTAHGSLTATGTQAAATTTGGATH